MRAQSEQVARFRALHQDMLVLPNAWDVASARMVQELGGKAVATSSAAVAWANGYADGEGMPRAVVLAATRAVLRVVAVPVTMVVLAAIVAAGLLWRRQRRRAQAAAAPAAGQQTGFYKASPAAPAGKRPLLACVLLQQQPKSELRVPAGRRCACPTTAVG